MARIENGRLIRGDEDSIKWTTKGRVWILVYTHAEGEQIYAYDTEADAKEAALDVIRKLRASHGVDPSLPENEVLNQWYLLTSGKQNIHIGSSCIRALKLRPKTGLL